MELKYVISTICRDSVKAKTVECMENAKWALAGQGIAFYWNTPYGDGKARSRSIAASKFLEHTPDATCLLFIDSDILFKPEDVSRIFQDVENGYDLIGGIFAVRGGTQTSSFGIGGKANLDGKIHEYEYIASGFMAISANLLRRIRDETPLPLLHPNDLKFYPFFEEKQYPDRAGEGIFLSEDYDFCEKARAIGVKPYVDTSVQLGHLGEYTYTLHDIIRNQEISKEKDIVANQKRLVNLRSDLAEFTSQSIPQVEQRLMYTRENMGNRWRDRKGSLMDFYTDNDECLYDSANFNLSHEYPRERLSPLVKLTKETIFDIGCGIGTADIMLTEQGNKVTGYEINKQSLDFCNFLKRKYNIPVDFTSDFALDESFSVVLAIDVLEHIEDLGDFLVMLGGKMKAGARLYHFDSFTPAVHHPQHFDHSGEIVDYLEKAGFTIKNDVWAIKL